MVMRQGKTGSAEPATAVQKQTCKYTPSFHADATPRNAGRSDQSMAEHELLGHASELNWPFVEQWHI